MEEHRKLIIILYEISIYGLTRAQADNKMTQLMSTNHLKDDLELKVDYIIREIWLPVQKSDNIEIIYPIRENKTKLKKVIQKLDSLIKQSDSSPLKKEWVKLLREIKLNELEND